MNKQELIEHLRNNENFDEAFRQAWVARLEKDGLTQDVLDELRNAVSDQIVQSYERVGVEDDENDPEYKAEHDKLMTELQKIDDELEAGLASMKEEANQVFQSAVKQMEDDSAQAIRDSI